MPGSSPTSKRKVKNECGFLYFLANNHHEKQTIQFLKYLLEPAQLTVLRELAVNDLAHNLPEYTQKKRKGELHKALRSRIRKLAQGELRKDQIHQLYPILKIWAQHALRYYGLC